MPVIHWLRGMGADIVSVVERGEAHFNDREILAAGAAERRFVLTHDSDFGTLAFRFGAPVFGVLIVRPGDLPPPATMATLAPLVTAQVDWSTPAVAVYKDGRLRMRRVGLAQDP